MAAVLHLSSRSIKRRRQQQQLRQKKRRRKSQDSLATLFYMWTLCSSFEWSTMFKNTFQSGFLSILYSIGSKPLQIWEKKVCWYRFKFPPNIMLTGGFVSKKTLISVTSIKEIVEFVFYCFKFSAQSTAYYTILYCLNMFVLTEVTVVAKQQVIMIAD